VVKLENIINLEKFSVEKKT